MLRPLIYHLTRHYVLARVMPCFLCVENQLIKNNLQKKCFFIW